MKFSEINTAIQEEMKLDPGLVTDSERVRFINDGLDELGSTQVLQLPHEDSNVSSQYPTLPDGLTKILDMYWNNVKLSPLSNDYNYDTQGTPTGYIYEAGTVRLYPKPDAAGTLKWVYAGNPTHCTSADVALAATTVPNIPLNWHRLLVDYTCYRSHRKNGNIVMASQYKRDYDLSLATCIREYISMLNSQVTTARSVDLRRWGSDVY